MLPTSCAADSARRTSGADVPVRLNPQVVPEAARPEPVVSALKEANALRAKLLTAQEQLASARADLEREEAADVAAAAERVRAGTSLGAIPVAVRKAPRGSRGSAAHSGSCRPRGRGCDGGRCQRDHHQ